MRRPRRNNALVVALYVNAALLLAILASLLSRDGAPSLTAPAYGAPLGQPIAGGGTIYLMPAQFSLNTFGCYLMDIDKQTLCAYQFYPGEKQLRFVAARQFSYDLRIKNFNTIPDPQDTRKQVESEAAGLRGEQKVEIAPPQNPEDGE